MIIHKTVYATAKLNITHPKPLQTKSSRKKKKVLTLRGGLKVFEINTNIDATLLHVTQPLRRNLRLWRAGQDFHHQALRVTDTIRTGAVAPVDYCGVLRQRQHLEQHCPQSSGDKTAAVLLWPMFTFPKHHYSTPLTDCPQTPHL